MEITTSGLGLAIVKRLVEARGGGQADYRDGRTFRRIAIIARFSLRDDSRFPNIFEERTLPIWSLTSQIDPEPTSVDGDQIQNRLTL